MIKSVRKRAISALCAAATAFSCAGGAIAPIAKAFAEYFTSSESEEAALCRTRFELYPNGEEAAETVVLDGLAPEGATAEASDVTELFGGDAVAAYDISITGADGEDYQPGEENPVYVEISDPDIPESGVLLWHISDEGYRERIYDFTVENGVLSFYASAFSVYEVVKEEDVKPFVPETENVSSVDQLTGSRSDKGFYLYYVNSKNEKNFFTGGVNSKGALTESGQLSQGAVWFFEPATGGYKIYTEVGGVKKYIHTVNDSGNNIELSESKADIIAVSLDSANKFLLKNSGEDKWLQHSGSGGGIRYWADSNNTVNSRILMYFADTVNPPDDVYGLDGKTYALLHSDSVKYGLMAETAGGKLGSRTAVVKNDPYDRNTQLIVTENENDKVSFWTFENVSGDEYKLSADVMGEKMYLKIASGSLSLVSEAEASNVKISADSEGKLTLSADGRVVSFSGGKFSSATSSPAQFELAKDSDYTNADFVVYSAAKISVSEAVNKQKVILYTRIWDDSNNQKKYRFYAVDHNGSLVECYERGDDIMWAGGRIDTLEWEFTEYYWEDTEDTDNPQPNYYYELYNPYSGKYLAPQIKDGQVLANSPVGINMPGRKAGEYYTDILAWDDAYYSYAGLCDDENNENVASCPRAEAATYYFAKLNELQPPEDHDLTTVETVDNNEFGIEMKMIDFTTKPNNTKNEQEEVLGDYTTFNDHKTTPKTGILSTDIKGNGYPDTMAGKNLSELYQADKLVDVNKLFLESTYNASGYFEFDSCQNFATLAPTNDGNFTVYREIGTNDSSKKPTLQHGQFFPYNDINAGVYAQTNAQNKYGADGNELPISDPRKDEKLYRVDDTNYYFGMELSASFIQTTNGRDAWDHDMIFEFTGDDDFWLYVDGELVIDLGGIHSALAGSVNFATGEVIVNGGAPKTLLQIFTDNYLGRNPGATDAELEAYLAKYFGKDENGQFENIFSDYSKHTMKIFYMERGAGASNLHMRFNLSYVTPGSVILKKKITGMEELEEELDFSLVQYPYQILYKLKDDDKEYLLTDTTDHYAITYQNSTKKIEGETYSPPGSDKVYPSVFFINPNQPAEVHFPENTIQYRIVEIGVNSEVYNDVKINGEPATNLGGKILVDGEIVDDTSGEGTYRCYSSDENDAEGRPNVVFSNNVNPEGFRTLSVTKKLYDENGDEISAADDDTTFNFRLYLTNGAAEDVGDLELASMYKYRVEDANGGYCQWDPDSQKFVPAETKIFYETSMNGTISKIPAGYTIKIPNLPINALFRVDERDYEVPLGYKLTGYERDGGTYILADGSSQNVGRVNATDSPHMLVKNKRGYEVRADKIWSDRGYMSDYAPIYTAVYIKTGEDSYKLVDGTIRRLDCPEATSVRYFFDAVEEGYSVDDYRIFEVELVNAVVNDDGEVTNYGTLHRLAEGELTTLMTLTKENARKKAAEEGGEDPLNYYANCSYAASYEQNTDPELKTDRARVDTITNTRTGGVVATLFDMDDHTKRLRNGVFELKKDGATVGTYTSDSNGRIVILYEFDRGSEYVLSETAPPRGYIGLPNEFTFTIQADDEVTVEGVATKWANGHKSDTASDNLVAYIDVYNKRFTLKAVKIDKDSGAKLQDAEFALYRGVNGVGGIVKDRTPMRESVSGSDGVIPGVDETLAPGRYYLKEKKAPDDNYEVLKDDVVFEIDESGGVTLLSAPDGVTLDGASSYKYELKLPNKSKDSHPTLLPTGIHNGLKSAGALIAVSLAGTGVALLTRKRRRDEEE